MPTFDITLNIYVLLGMILFSMATGFMGRRRQLGKKERRIVELETEMVDTHAELLELQRENGLLETRIKDVTNPVIAMKSNKLEDKNLSAGAK
jgi:hypothetical protein